MMRYLEASRKGSGRNAALSVTAWLPGDSRCCLQSSVSIALDQFFQPQPVQCPLDLVV